MSLLQRRKAKLSAKTNDLSSVTWESMSNSTKVAESLVGKNAQIRYGIATETDMGLPESRFVIVPTLEDISDPAVLSKMYQTEVLMSGIHAVCSPNGDRITSDFPVDRLLREVSEIEWDNRHELKAVALPKDFEYSLIPIANPDSSSWLTQVAIHLNFREFSHNYPTISEGARVLGAHSVAMAYRMGILESHAAREFIFCQVAPGDQGSYKIIAIDPSYLRRPERALNVGDVTSGDNLRINDKMVELGLGLAVGAGTTHYMMNHTTGGAKLGGHNLKALSVNGVYEIDPGMGRPSEIDQTTFYYNVTHPVNKRAIANLVLRGSHVSSWHKNAFLLSPSVIFADTFMAYRQSLIPAGAHKAFIAAAILKDICASKLGIFLPDQEICKTVVSVYNQTLAAGARAHIGARYYTDELPVINQSTVDAFIPIAAYYVQQRMPTSSYASSPHLSIENGDGAPATWKSIVQATIRAGAVGAAEENVATYLKYSGAAGYSITLATPEGRDEALRINDVLLKEISALI